MRLSGLAGVAAAGTASRADGRSGVQLQVQGRAPERATTARLTDDDSLAPADLASSTDAPPAAADDDLDALLASLGDEPETADPAAGADSDDAMDVDLDELLKSLG